MIDTCLSVNIRFHCLCCPPGSVWLTRGMLIYQCLVYHSQANCPQASLASLVSQASNLWSLIDLARSLGLYDHTDHCRDRLLWSWLSPGIYSLFWPAWVLWCICLTYCTMIFVVPLHEVNRTYECKLDRFSSSVLFVLVSWRSYR